MRLRIFAVILPVLICCDNEVVTTPNEPGQRLLLKDCENDVSGTLPDGYWYTATDSAGGGASTVLVSKNPDGTVRCTGEGYHSEHSFSMSWRLSKGDYSFDPFVICGFNLFSEDYRPFDASAYEGISYVVKGAAHAVRVETGAVTDFCYYEYDVASSDVWKKVTVPFSALFQKSWGNQVTFDKTTIKGISWQITGNENDSASIHIDDVYLEKTVTADQDDSSGGFILPGIGIDMKAYLYKPGEDSSYPAVIVLPGGTAASDIGTVYEHHKHFGEVFSRKGITVLVLDYSSEKRSFFDTMQIDDIGQAVDYCKEKTFIQNAGIFLAGFSIGGANALRVAGSRDDIAGIICYFSPCDWSVTGGGYAIRKQPISYCDDISCPVLILQGDSDKVTDIAQSILLYDSLQALGKESQLVIYEGAAHGFTYEGAPPGNCVYNREATEQSYLKVESFITGR